MEIVALCIALTALVLSVLAYRRRSKHDFSSSEKTLNQQIERLSALAQRASESVTARVRSRYQGDVKTIAYLQSRVAALRQEAIEEIREDLSRIGEKLERLAERAARELKDLKSGLDFTLLEMEVGLRLTVDDARAHLKLIEAKRELVLARRAALRNDLLEAEARVEAAMRLIDEARSFALGYHQNIVALQKQAQALLADIGKSAQALRAAIEAILERTNRLLRQMDGFEAARTQSAA